MSSDGGGKAAAPSVVVQWWQLGSKLSSTAAFVTAGSNALPACTALSSHDLPLGAAIRELLPKRFLANEEVERERELQREESRARIEEMVRLRRQKLQAQQAKSASANKRPVDLAALQAMLRAGTAGSRLSGSIEASSDGLSSSLGSDTTTTAAPAAAAAAAAAGGDRHEPDPSESAEARELRLLLEHENQMIREAELLEQEISAASSTGTGTGTPSNNNSSNMSDSGSGSATSLQRAGSRNSNGVLRAFQVAPLQRSASRAVSTRREQSELDILEAVMSIVQSPVLLRKADLKLARAASASASLQSSSSLSSSSSSDSSPAAQASSSSPDLTTDQSVPASPANPTVHSLSASAPTIAASSSAPPTSSPSLSASSPMSPPPPHASPPSSSTTPTISASASASPSAVRHVRRNSKGTGSAFRRKNTLVDVKTELDVLQSLLEDIELKYTDVMISESWKPARALVGEMVQLVEQGTSTQPSSSSSYGHSFVGTHSLVGWLACCRETTTHHEACVEQHLAVIVVVLVACQRPCVVCSRVAPPSSPGE